MSKEKVTLVCIWIYRLLRHLYDYILFDVVKLNADRRLLSV